MKIKSVKIEGFHNVVNRTYEFDNLNYVIGPNGSGKSTVLQAIQLALLGYIPGTDKNKTAIFKHAGGHTLAVELKLDDNGTEVTVSRLWTGLSSVTASVQITPEGYDISQIVSDIELPIFNFNEFVDMTANKLKDWFIDFLPDNNVSVDWSVVLQKKLDDLGIENCNDLVESSCAEIKRYNLSGIDEIRKANEHFKSLVSFKKSEISRLESTIKSLIYYDDCDDTLSIDEVKSQISKLQLDRSDAMSRMFAKQKNATTEAELQKFKDLAASVDEDDRLKGLVDEVSELVQQMNSLNEVLAKMRNTLLEYQADISDANRIINSNGVCPYSSEECPTMIDNIVSAKQSLDAAQTAFDELYAKKNDTERELSQLAGRERNLQLEIANIKNMYVTRDTLQKSLVEVPDGPTDYLSIDVKINELNDILVKLQSNAQYQQMIDSLTSDKFKLDAELAACKGWVDITGVNGIQSSGSSPFVSLSSEMDEYITKLFNDATHARFDIQAKANSFSFGIERDGKYIPFNLLSSGEKCMYTLALMLAIVKNSSSPLKLVLVDDLLDHLDDNNVDNLFKALMKIKDIQIILAGVKAIGQSKGNAGIANKVNCLHTLDK